MQPRRDEGTKRTNALCVSIVLAAEEPSRVRGGGLFGGASPLENYVGEATKYVIGKAPCRVILTAPPSDWQARFAREHSDIPERGTPEVPDAEPDRGGVS